MNGLLKTALKGKKIVEMPLEIFPKRFAYLEIHKEKTNEGASR